MNAALIKFEDVQLVVSAQIERADHEAVAVRVALQSDETARLLLLDLVAGRGRGWTEHASPDSLSLSVGEKTSTQCVAGRDGRFSSTARA